MDNNRFPSGGSKYGSVTMSLPPRTGTAGVADIATEGFPGSKGSVKENGQDEPAGEAAVGATFRSAQCGGRRADKSLESKQRFEKWRPRPSTRKQDQPRVEPGSSASAKTFAFGTWGHISYQNPHCWGAVFWRRTRCRLRHCAVSFVPSLRPMLTTGEPQSWLLGCPPVGGVGGWVGCNR